MAKQTLLWTVLLCLMLIPTATSLYAISQLRQHIIKVEESGLKRPQVVCLEKDNCAIRVFSKWYRINGVIDMDEITPPEYKFEDQSKEPEADEKEGRR